MPNKKAAIKRLKQDEKKYAQNHSKKAELRTMVKKARTLIESQDKEKADEILLKLESKLDKAAKTNVIRKGNADRRISRLRAQWSRIGTDTK